MRKVNEYVETLKTNMKKDVREKLKVDKAEYKTLLKNLLIQVSNFILDFYYMCPFLGFD
jgi:hypothetical protein